MGSKKSQTVGFRYFMQLHFGICYGPVDRFIRFLGGERLAWMGIETDNNTIDINAGSLYGGDEREGGLEGAGTIMMGGSAQTLPGNVAAALPSPSPGFRGIFSFFYDGLIAANNPYIKAMAFQVTRIKKGWAGGDAACWYPEKAELILTSTSTIPVTLTSSNIGVTPAVGITVGGLDPADTILVQLNPAGTYRAWAICAANDPMMPPAHPEGVRWRSRFWVKNNTTGVQAMYGNPTISFNWWEDGYATPAEAEAHYPGDVLLTGGSSYTFFIYDDVTWDDSGGMALNLLVNPGAAAMNPAHIVYQCLTDPQWGMGYPTAAINDANFRAVADALFAENFGLCMLWNQQDEIGNFVQQVLDHIGAVLYSDPKTGLFNLQLLRGDYDPATLEVFDESKIVSLDSFQRVGYGDTVNEITVVYRDSVTNKDTPLTVQNLANITAQGAVVSKTVQYPGVPSASLAARLAQRDLLAQSTPLARGRMTVNRNAWGLFPGRVFKLTWPKLGVASVVMRVLGVSGGSLVDGALTVEFAEDVFGLPLSSYVQQEAGGWEEPDTTPPLITLQTVAEIPYWTLVRELSAADMAALDQDAAYFSPIAARPSSLSMSFDTYSRTGAAPFALSGIGAFVPVGVLSADLTPQATTILVPDSIDLANAPIGDVAIIGQGRAGGEFVLVEAVDLPTSTITISRGVLDTVPQAHPAGTLVFFTDGGDSEDRTERATGEVVDMQLATVATGGSLDPALATVLTTEAAAQRQFRPYPPGDFKINGLAWPSSINVPLVLTWAHRDRLTQTAYVVEQDEASIGPEAGTTYTARFINDTTNAVIGTVTGITGTTTTYDPVESVNIRVELEAVRDGVVSWQAQTRRFLFIGAGGTRVTEAGDRRITEGGDVRVME